MSDEYDVIVVGGGAAGLAAAVALARSLRRVAVIDDGTPRNLPADGVHNYLGREGTAPVELYRIGRSELESYGGTVIDARAVSATGAIDEFTVTVSDGRALSARRLVLATGARDVLPDVPGLAERWGRDVLHCPYCHGYEVRGRRIGVLSTTPMSTHQALLFRQLTDDVTLFLHTGPRPGDDELALLAARDVRLVDGKVTGLEVTDDRLTGVDVSTGTTVAVDALTVATRVEARAELAEGLGLTPQDFEINGFVAGTMLAAEPNGATAVPGVWVAGNVATVMAQVVTSAAAGLGVGAMVNAELVMADARAAAA